MATSRDTRVLFVPYRPGLVRQHSYENGEISQQKHAAREYHRKAKQRRQCSKKVTSQPAIFRQKSDSEASQSPGSQDHVPVRPRTASTSLSIALHDIPTRDRSVSSPILPHDWLGAGSLDPMNSLPISNMSPYAQRMLDFSLTYQWSVFSFCNPGSTMEDMKRHVMSRILSSETSLYAVVFAGATYFALRRPGAPVSQENLMLRLNYKTRALRKMSLEIEELGPQVPNETLYTMLSLAAFGASEKLQPPSADKDDHLLAVFHDLDFYCRLPCEWAHLRALSHLLKQRGGLAALNRPGFGIALSLYDTLTSFQRLESPAFPLLKSTKQLMSRWPMAEGNPSPLSTTLGTGFKGLSSVSAYAQFSFIVGFLSETILGWERYQRSAPDAPILCQIAQARNAILHDLLCLPDLSESVHSPEECLYELCRLGTLCFKLIFLYPLSRSNGPYDALAKRMMVMLDITSSFRLWSTHPDLMLWATFMGGIVSKETPFRYWFVEELNSSGIKHTMIAWPRVSNVLASFFWLNDECDADGICLWRETWELTQSRAVSI